MLPWRVQLQDPMFRRQAIGLIVVLVLLFGAFSQGLSVSLSIGGRDSQTVAGPQVGDGGEFDQISDGTGSTDPTVTTDGLTSGQIGSASTADGSSGSTDGLFGVGGSTEASSGATSTGDGDQAVGPAPTQPGNQAAGGQTSPASAPAATGPAPAPAPCQGAALGASDRGVTKDSIKLGILVADLGPLSQAGFDVGVEGDYNQVMDAWTNELARIGGVACRKKITYVIERFDVLSVDDMIAKCKRMTQDHKVFAVLTTGGYDSVAQLCVARDNKTPFLNTEPEPAGWYRESAPYLWNLLMSKDRMHRNHVRYLAESGEITPKTKIGVIYHGIPNVGPSVEDALLPELARAGIKPTQVTKLSSDNQQALAQINQTVVQYQAAGIEYVFMPMNLIFKTQFMQQAEGQNYLPTYTDSDHYFGCFDFVTSTYPEQSWDRTKCVSATLANGVPDLAKYSASHPFGQYAEQVYKRTNPSGYSAGGERDEDQTLAQLATHTTIGSLILAWSQAANRVGPDLTRPAWGASMGQTGVFDKIVSPEPISFGPQKWDGPDHITVVEWHAEAGNGYEERRYHRLVAPRPAFY